MSNGYKIGFENTESLCIDGQDVIDFYMGGITEAVYDAPEGIIKRKRAKEFKLAIPKSLAEKKYHSPYGYDLDINQTIKERLEIMDIVDITLPDGEILEVPWKGSDDFNKLQRVYLANYLLKESSSENADNFVVDISYANLNKDSSNKHETEKDSIKGVSVSSLPGFFVSTPSLGSWELPKLLDYFNKRLNKLENKDTVPVSEFNTISSYKLKDHHERN